MPELVGLIPAAGKGTRAYPYTKDIPKGMLPVAGRPLLEHSLVMLRDQAHIREFFIVVGDLGQVIRDHFGDGAAWNVKITYIQNQHIDLGLAHSVRLAGEHITGPFLMVLSDEFYLETNHSALARQSLDPEELGACGVFRSQDWNAIKRNYTLHLDGERISSLEEKPADPQEPILGTGTLLLSPRVFRLLEEAFAREGEPPDFIGTLGEAVAHGLTMRPFFLEGRYVNINDVDSLHWANFLGRSKLMPKAKHSVVVQSWGQEEGLARVMGEYDRLDCVDEVLLVLPDGCPEPAWLAGLGKSRVLHAPPGQEKYGALLAYGIEAARGDIVTITEGYYSFYPNDVKKLLAYIADAELVVGTRTTRQLIQQGTRMRGVVRLAHVFLAKLIELLWLNYSVRLSDVGCTFRTIWKDCYRDIAGQLHSRGPAYALEMTLEVMKSRRRLIEVPVSFLHTNEVLAARHQKPSVFFRFLATVLLKRLGLI
ncbi:MAG: NTP transferase domain-containing protein [Deltaproteobacteria bacterium]|nr:NTP transferase domain-containing protein [Deltaproteobacteria bacterium]